MSNKYNLWYQLKIISIALISVLFLTFLFLSVSKEQQSRKQAIVDYQTSWQEKMLNDSIYDAVQLAPENFEEHIVTEIMPRFRYNEASYGVFYADNHVIYENNNEYTQEYQGKTIRDVYGAYSYYGGDHLAEVLEPMEKGQSGKDYFVKNHFRGRELITWIAFPYQGKQYVLGAVTVENYLLSQYDFSGDQNRTYAFVAIYSFLLVLFAALLIFGTYRHNKVVSVLQKERENQDHIIERIKGDITVLEQNFESLSIYDLLTGLYNRKFFDVFFPKMEAEIFMPVSVAILDINGLKLINSALGYEKGDQAIIAVAKACTELCGEGDVIARYGNDEFAIIMINTSNKESLKRLEEIAETVRKVSINGFMVDVSYGVATKKAIEDNIYDVIVKAERNLQVDKLTADNSAHSASVSILRKILQEKTTETSEHCERIRNYAAKLADAVGLNDKKVRELSLLAYLHDVGKITMPDAILNKRGPLDAEEYEIMKTHPEAGYNIAMSSPDLKIIAKYILQHHEKWDGSGYPRGIAGKKISLEARIIAIADAYDAMVHKRVYKGKMNSDEALDEIERCAGTQFDPELAEIFVTIMRAEPAEKRE